MVIALAHHFEGGSSRSGYVFSDGDLQQAVEALDVVIVAGSDGYMRVALEERCPLHALVRVDADLHEVIDRIGELGKLE